MALKTITAQSAERICGLVLAAVRNPAKIDGSEVGHGVAKTYRCAAVSREARKGCLGTRWNHPVCPLEPVF